MQHLRRLALLDNLGIHSYRKDMFPYSVVLAFHIAQSVDEESIEGKIFFSFFQEQHRKNCDAVTISTTSPTLVLHNTVIVCIVHSGVMMYK